jgi:hypothetical protein
MNPCIVAPVTSPSAHKTSSITAIVYNINLFGLICRLALFRASRQSVNGLHACRRHSDSHVVNHARHAVNVSGEFGDETFFGGICGNAAHSDDAIRR